MSCFPDDNFLTAQYRAGLFLLMKISHDPSASRYEHVGKGLRRSDLNPDPIKQFGNWFTAAIEAGIRDVNAMSLATAGPDSRPSVRIVLLKSVDNYQVEVLLTLALAMGCYAVADAVQTSGPIAVARLPQGIRPSTALRPFAGPRACGGMHLFLRYIRVRPRHGASHVRSHSVWLSTQHLRPN